MKSILLALGVVLSVHSALAAECRGKFCTGGYVIDTENRVGKIFGFEGDKTVKYETSSSYHSDDASNLKIATPAYNGIKKGNYVVDQENRVGSVHLVFEDGRTFYETSRAYLVSSTVSPSVDEINGIRRDTYVIDETNTVGKVHRVFADGRVFFETTREYRISKNISKEVANYKGITKGNYVVDQDDNVGKVHRVFEDGRTFYETSRAYLVSNKVSPEVRSLDGYKSGDYVANNDDMIGKILRVFADGRIFYETSSSYLIGRNLSRETATHPDYNKETYYTDSDYNVGKTVRFFENKLVFMQSVGGYGYSRRSLIGAVDTLEGIRAGGAVTVLDRATIADMKEGTVELLFPNGAMIVKIEESQQVAAKLTGFFTEKETEKKLSSLELNHWLSGFRNLVAKKNKIRHFEYYHFVSYSLAATSEMLSVIKKSVLEMITKKPELVENKELYKKLVEYLSSEMPPKPKPEPKPMPQLLPEVLLGRYISTMDFYGCTFHATSPANTTHPACAIENARYIEIRHNKSTNCIEIIGSPDDKFADSKALHEFCSINKGFVGTKATWTTNDSLIDRDKSSRKIKWTLYKRLNIESFSIKQKADGNLEFDGSLKERTTRPFSYWQDRWEFSHTLIKLKQ
ncbi:MAG: hypothetical protein A2583_03510 [Bdellovibrionales bacterium RIFOXYD1_FULL_53_11]|nr:MAG: hypothetical protein A2583_03510 [Bdellovibrionales bacterium RIFOXYD1_FULL_53_11]